MAHTWVPNSSQNFPPNCYTHINIAFGEKVCILMFSLCIKTNIEHDWKNVNFYKFRIFHFEKQNIPKDFSFSFTKVFSLRKAFFENVGISKIKIKIC
jgi:hypothetical protein